MFINYKIGNFAVAQLNLSTTSRIGETVRDREREKLKRGA